MEPAAVGGAGLPPSAMESNAKEPLVGRIRFGPANKDLLLKLFKGGDAEGLTEFRPLGVLADPSITYLGKLDESVREKIEIVFDTLESKKVGRVMFFINKKKPEMYLEAIDTDKEMGKGYGKRMMSAMMDFARRAGSSTISLDSLPSAVSFYLGVDTPFTFNDPANNTKYKTRYNTLVSGGINDRTAKRTAGDAFQNGNDSVIHIVPMTAKMRKRKSRRSNRKRDTRRRKY